MQLARLDGHRTACCRESGDGLNGGIGRYTVVRCIAGRTLYSVAVCSGCWAPAMSQAPQYKPPLMLSAYKIGQTPWCHGPLQALRNLLSATQAAQAVPLASTQSNGSTPICHSSSLGPNPPLEMGCLRVCGTVGS